MRFGWLLNLVSAPVLMAFTQGAALLIIGSQLPDLLGLEGRWFHAWNLSAWHLPSAAFGLSCLVLLTLAKRWMPAFPSVLVIVVASAGVSVWAGFESSGGAVVDPLPEGLPALSIPGLLDWKTLQNLLLPTFRMDAELDFASASDLLRAVSEHMAAHPDTHHVCLFAHPINRI